MFGGGNISDIWFCIRLVLHDAKIGVGRCPWCDAQRIRWARICITFIAKLRLWVSANFGSKRLPFYVKNEFGFKKRLAFSVDEAAMNFRSRSGHCFLAKVRSCFSTTRRRPFWKQHATHFFCRSSTDLGGQNASSDPWLKCGSSFLPKRRRRFSIQMAAHAWGFQCRHQIAKQYILGEFGQEPSAAFWIEKRGRFLDEKLRPPFRFKSLAAFWFTI